MRPRRAQLIDRSSAYAFLFQAMDNCKLHPPELIDVRMCCHFVCTWSARFDGSAAGYKELVQSGPSSCASQLRHDCRAASQSAALRHSKTQCSASVWQRCAGLTVG